MQPSECLDKAADLLRNRGWIQGSYRNKHGFCLVGSLIYVSKYYSGACDGTLSDAKTAHHLLEQYCTYGKNHINPASWNDIPGRTKQEVLTLLRNAADVERIKEQALVEAHETV